MYFKSLSAAVLANLLVVGSAMGAPGAWTLSESSGQVWVVQRGVSKAAVRGGSVEPGSTIATGRGGRAVLVRGEEYLVVAPGTRLQVSAQSDGGGITQFFEEVGNVLYKIRKKATPHFGVQTPYLAAVVKGTTFSVTVSERGASVQVIEGAVEVATLDGGARQLVTPGNIGMVGADSRFRLSISGNENRVLESPAAPAKDSSTATTADAGAAGGPDKTAERVASAAAPEGTITAAISEGPVSLGAVTGGMIAGELGGASGASTLHPARLADLSDAPGSSGNAGNTGNGQGNGNAGAGDDAPGGSGNAGNTGNGQGNGNAGAGDDAPGNSGNAGNNGNGQGNGNAGAGDDSPGNSGNAGNNGNGQGNGNAGAGDDSPGNSGNAGNNGNGQGNGNH